MAPRKPEEPEPPFLAFLKWVLSSRERVRRLALLISVAIINLVLLAALGATVVLYLKADPQRWAAALGLAAVALGAARAAVSIRRRRASRRGNRTSLRADSAPKVTQGRARAQRQSDAAGDGEGNDDVRE
jgi:hypothetical protein